ncbi:MlaD family protein [Mycobacterium sp. pUA109]|uniref:MlaD family protein n=1 Tax=Mycobacterium sp. pUA109 TaxID=3238982 RepID=UPI00351AF937
MIFRNLLSFAVFLLMVVSAVYYIGAVGVRIGAPNDRVNVSMTVADVNGLVVDSNVLLRGVPVGKVSGIRSAADGATIDFYIDKRFPVPRDSEVRLENLSALGESYIGLIPRTTSGPMLRDGQRVGTEEIRAPASVSQLAASVGRVLAQMDPGRLSRLVDEVDRALPDQQAVLPNLARASTLLRNAVASMNGDGSTMLANFQALLENAGWVGPAIAEISDPLRDSGNHLGALLDVSISAFTATGPPFGFKYLGEYLDLFQHFLDTRAPDLKIVAQTLAPNVEGIAASLMNFDTGQILSNMLDAIPDDGVVTLHLTVPNP